MLARVAAAMALLSTAAAPALAGNHAWFDRPDSADLNSRAAVSNDSYVRAFGWTWGDMQFKPDDKTPPAERQARDNLTDPHDLAPGRPSQGDGVPPRGRRGKVSMT
ncbi:hypothetical protein [Cupriavidus agavae]|uniref:Uncharacterized protein n=1 Tax=Cupriavidus agavae TaxID=1001822 RepID=A0A4V2FF25_9BURK|nr:hypothetical protein [Cupriavidus agavae]RZT31799.1 hypothetical protein EV147_4298 [Cupriavidus agavae]